AGPRAATAASAERRRRHWPPAPPPRPRRGSPPEPGGEQGRERRHVRDHEDAREEHEEHRDDGAVDLGEGPAEAVRREEEVHPDRRPEVSPTPVPERGAYGGEGVDRARDTAE